MTDIASRLRSDMFGLAGFGFVFYDAELGKPREFSGTLQGFELTEETPFDAGPAIPPPDTPDFPYWNTFNTDIWEHLYMQTIVRTILFPDWDRVAGPTLQTDESGYQVFITEEVLA